MKTALRILLVLALLGGLGYFFMVREAAPPAPVAVVQPSVEAPVQAEPTTPAEPPIQFPVEQILPEQAQEAAAAGEPAPDPDALAAEALAGAAPAGSIGDVMLMQDLIRRIVVTVDNLPREKVARKLAPVRAASGPLVVTGEEGRRAIGAENSARYLPYVRFAEAVNLKALVAGYVRLYSFFQQAYRDLGYPSGYFNDRLVEVIDHLLAAPEPGGPIALVQPKVLYQFADPQLEALSAGQKIMVRMGADNAKRVKVRLAALRSLLAGKRLQ